MLITCDWCGQEFDRRPSHVNKTRNFCCTACRAKFLSKKHNPSGYVKHEHLSDYNRKMNLIKMTSKTKSALRAARLGSGEGKGYTKLYGVHEHRAVMEQLIGRPLRPGEVIHHINGNKRDNRPENLMLFASQSEHAKYHAEMRKRKVSE